MGKPTVIHLFVKLDDNQRSALKSIVKERYGKASLSLLAQKLFQGISQEILGKTEIVPSKHQQPSDNLRLNLQLSPAHRRYLTERARLQHSTLNDVARDVFTEYIDRHPVLSNAEVQALYQSNYQLLRLGRNINQIARQLNSIQPGSFSTHQLNDLAQFIAQHTETVGRVLRKQGKPFKYRPIGEHHATTEPTD